MGNGLGIKISADELANYVAPRKANNTPSWIKAMNTGAKHLRDIGLQIGADGTDYAQSVRAKVNTDSGFSATARTGFQQGKHSKYFNVGAGYNKTLNNGGHISLNADTGIYDGKSTKQINVSAQYSHPLKKGVSRREQELRAIALDQWQGE